MTESAAVRLMPSTPVEGEWADASGGLLGAFLYDPEVKQPVALTPAQFVRRDFALHARAGAKGAENSVITRGNYRAPPPKLGKHSADELLVVIPLPGSIWLDQVFTSEHASIVMGPWRTLGQAALIWRGGAPPTRVRVQSVQACFTMPHPDDGRSTRFLDAIELRDVDESKILSRGDIGAVVTTEEGGLLGVVVAGASEVAYAAPIAPVVERERLVSLTPMLVDRHNGLPSLVLAQSEYESQKQNALEMWRRPMPGRTGTTSRRGRHKEMTRAEIEAEHQAALADFVEVE